MKQSVLSLNLIRRALACFILCAAPMGAQADDTSKAVAKHGHLKVTSHRLKVSAIKISSGLLLELAKV